MTKELTEEQLEALREEYPDADDATLEVVAWSLHITEEE